MTSSLNAIASYWPIAKFQHIKKGGKQPKFSMWWGHLKIFYWQYLIFQSAAVVVAFFDTMDLLPMSTGSFDMAVNGTTIIVMASVYAVTLFFNLMYFKSEKRLHKALNAYAGLTKYAEDPKFCLDADNCDQATEEDLDEAAEEFFDDEEWEW